MGVEGRSEEEESRKVEWVVVDAEFLRFVEKRSSKEVAVGGEDGVSVTRKWSVGDN